MNLRAPLIFITLFATAAFATQQARDINLGGLTVNHVNTSGTHHTGNLSLTKLDKDASYDIRCDYAISGPSKKTAVAIHIEFNEVYLNGSDEPYYQDGIERKSGTMLIPGLTLNENYPQIEIRNYDETNDIVVSNCRAIWTNG